MILYHAKQDKQNEMAIAAYEATSPTNKTTKHEKGETRGHSSLCRMSPLINHLASYLFKTMLTLFL
jgi:hypothetical protein